MTKNEFLSQLHRQLLSLPEQERRDIIQDFEEHFSIGADKGKTEDQICEDLGDPWQCAQQYLNPSAEEGAQPRPGVVPPPPYQAPPYPNMQQPYPQGTPAENPVNRIGFAIILAVLILAAFVVYPVSIGLVVAFFALVVGGFTAGIVMGSWLLGAFLFTLSLVVLSVGMLLFLCMTWALKACVQKLRA